MNLLNSLFHLDERGATVATEITGGTTTFLTMSYIIFVQPAIMQMAGIDFGSAMMVTCISAGIASTLMAFLANYPIALAPAMGHNFFFSLTVCGAVATGGMGFTWQEGLAAVFISGCLFLFLSLFGFREKVISAIPTSLRLGIAVGIGLLIGLLGLQWGGVVVDRPCTLVGFGEVTSSPFLLTVFGLFIILGLTIASVKGAMLFGITASTIAALATGMTTYTGVISAPPSLSPSIFKLDLMGLISHPDFWVVISIFFSSTCSTPWAPLWAWGQQRSF